MLCIKARNVGRLILCGFGIWATSTGCTAISIEPSCPSELSVGESGIIAANESNPGQIATYHWEVLPSDAGTIEEPDLSRTTFTALKEGEAVLWLTASDGIYMVQSQCTALITLVTVVVSLEAVPGVAVVGEAGLLTCMSAGETEASEFTIIQTGGDPVEFTEILPGIVAFTSEQAGELTFECTGTGADGATSRPASISVIVTETTGGEDNGTDGDRDGGRNPRTPR